MGAVDHDGRLLPLLEQRLLGGLHARLVVVRPLAPAAQDHEAMLVTLGARDGREALLRDAHEVVPRRRAADGINGDRQVAVGAVLEADGEGQARGELAVQLGLGGAGADGADGDEVGEELRADGVEHLGGDGHAGRRQVLEELARDAQALVDLEGLVDVRVVDEALPAHGRARLLEVGAHDDVQVGRQPLGERLEVRAVLEGRGRVVDRAGAHDDQEAVGGARDDVRGGVAAGHDGLEGLRGHGDLGGEERGRDEGVLAEDLAGR